MSVEFISGKPGGGKSLSALRLISRVLQRTNMCVVTNLAIKPGELNAWLQQTYPEATINLHERLRLLNETETGQFWLYRSCRIIEDQHGRRAEWVQLAAVSEEEQKAGKHIDYSSCNGLPPVLYVIDEIHNYFNAREWMKTGKEALFYLSQHRKLGDDVICITQSINNVDKQFRSVAQSFTYVTNLRKTKFLKLFTLPPLFVANTYLHPATGAAGETAMEVHTFTLDLKGLAACYDTAAGVGIRGTLADTNEKPRGLPWWLFAVVPVLIIGFVWYMPNMIGGVVGHVTNVKVPNQPKLVGIPNPATPATNAVALAPVTPRPVSEPFPPGNVALGPNASARTAPQEEVWLSGLIRQGNQIKVWLSDGRTYTSHDKELTFIGPNFVVINQVVYRFQAPKMNTRSDREEIRQSWR